MNSQSTHSNTPLSQRIPSNGAPGVLTDKVAIVTGASSGIGYATARLFASEGAKVVAVARRQERLDELVGHIQASGGSALAITGDVSQEATAGRAVEAAVDHFGGLHIAFNNAGTVGKTGSLAELSLSDWHRTLETNLTSAFLGAKYQIPALQERGGGSLLFTGTFVGHTIGLPDMAAYAASKAGLIGLVQVLAAELGPQGIRVNAVLPGGTDTEMNTANAPDAPPEMLAYLQGIHALKRLARPEEIASVVLHLASDAASFITGSALLVDGGVSITKN